MAACPYSTDHETDLQCDTTFSGFVCLPRPIQVWGTQKNGLYGPMSTCQPPRAIIFAIGLLVALKSQTIVVPLTRDLPGQSQCSHSLTRWFMT